MKCPYDGFDCVDPGQPTDCEINVFCLFKTIKDREDFEALPDKFVVKIDDGREFKFKTFNQVKFLIADLPKDLKYEITTDDLDNILEVVKYLMSL